jgi:hypothetical protein
VIYGVPSPVMSSRQNHSHSVRMLAERSSRSDENQHDCLGWSGLDKTNIVSERQVCCMFLGLWGARFCACAEATACD